VNLSDANLSETNLRGGDLVWAKLGGADLGWAKLGGANLKDANLRGANLSGANLSGANLREANPYHADLDSPLKGRGGLAILEKVSEWRWTLQLAQAVLFADLALLWWTGHGMLESASPDELLGNSGILAVHLLVFGVLVSIALLSVGIFFAVLIWKVRVRVVRLPTRRKKAVCTLETYGICN
jgi:Pentapeptide repeats (8 copies)